MRGKRAKLIRAYVAAIWASMSDEQCQAWDNKVLRFYRHAKRDWTRRNHA